MIGRRPSDPQWSHPLSTSLRRRSGELLVRGLPIDDLDSHHTTAPHQPSDPSKQSPRSKKRTSIPANPRPPPVRRSSQPRAAPPPPPPRGGSPDRPEGLSFATAAPRRHTLPVTSERDELVEEKPLQRQLEEAKHNASRLQLEIKMLKEKTQHLDEALKGTTSICHELQRELESAKAERDTLREAKHEGDIAWKELREEIAGLKAERDKLVEMLEEEREATRGLRAELGRAKAEVQSNEAHLEAARLGEQNAMLQRESEVAKQSVRDAHSRLIRAEAANSDLQERFRVLSQMLASLCRSDYYVVMDDGRAFVKVDTIPTSDALTDYHVPVPVPVFMGVLSKVPLDEAGGDVPSTGSPVTVRKLYSRLAIPSSSPPPPSTPDELLDELDGWSDN
eukprot:Sspe_Gene.68582::Locus_40437_Transcript_1_1_Confidence_1.000_Length_1659::g.68582::m.68582